MKGGDNIEIKKALIRISESLDDLIEPQYIIIHHTEEIGWNIYDTNDYHISLGWEGIGYNYFIEEDGTVFEGRGMKIGAHTRGMNKISIGICLSGNFDIEFPRQEQLISLKKLCTFFMKKYNISIERVIGHREVENSKKSCPGTNFDMEQIRKSLI